MDAFVFFLLGLPCAFVAERLIDHLCLYDEIEYEDEEFSVQRLRLPWQKGAWPARLRWIIVAPIPALLALAGLNFALVPAFVVSLLLMALLVCLATDLLSFRVPDVITFPSIALAFLAALLLPDADLESAALAAGLAGGFFLVVCLAAPRGGFGFGDVKLAVLIGAVLGLPAAYQALFAGMLAGGVIILALFFAGVVGRRQAVPYAPFLILATLAMILLKGAAFAPL